MNNVCKDCCGNLVEQSELVDIAYRGNTSLRPSLYSVCDGCGVEIATAEQTQRNKADTLVLRE